MDCSSLKEYQQDVHNKKNNEYHRENILRAFVLYIIEWARKGTVDERGRQQIQVWQKEIVFPYHV